VYQDLSISNRGGELRILELRINGLCLSEYSWTFYKLQQNNKILIKKIIGSEEVYGNKIYTALALLYIDLLIYF